ncbi:MAG: class I SAM-dependent methyltransferase [Angelakisella sp.]
MLCEVASGGFKIATVAKLVAVPAPFATQTVRATLMLHRSINCFATVEWVLPSLWGTDGSLVFRFASNPAFGWREHIVSEANLVASAEVACAYGRVHHGLFIFCVLQNIAEEMGRKMSNQNIYDNQDFFDGYKKLRGNPSSANDLVEKPALFSLAPNLYDKTVLDIGCGYGENCVQFLKLGASMIKGIDISAKMLEIANKENSSPNIQYINKSMTELAEITEKFDVVFSSLAVHYIEDFDKLVADIFNLLNQDGYFIFSQEHPLTTALLTQNYWTRNAENERIHYNLTTYALEGERKVTWIVDGVIKYHRTISSIINSLSGAGFAIEKMLEPIPSKDIMEQYPSYKKYIHKPDFLLIKAKKCNPVK